MTDPIDIPPAVARSAVWKRLAPLVVLVALIVLVFALRLDRYLSFEALRDHREALLAFVHARPVAAPLLFVVVYATAAALSVPGAVILTITGGFLFGVLAGSVLAVVGATLGAICVFLVAKTSLGDPLRARAGPWLGRMEAGFSTNALSYMLFLRLMPVFPFWLVNLVPAFLGVRLRIFALATFFGIMPGTIVYASVGNGLGAVFDAGDTPDLGIVFRPEILLPIVGLALLSLLPIAYRKYRTRIV